MLVQCTQPCGPRALDASKFSARALDLSHFTRKVNAHLLTSNSRCSIECKPFKSSKLNLELPVVFIIHMHRWFISFLTTHNWQKWKRVFLTCPCHKSYGDEVVGLKSCKYTWKITIFVKMWNLGQYRENLIFCQKLLNWSSNFKILLHMCDTYNCDYLKHSTISFQVNQISVKYDFPFQFCIFYVKIT